jgi:hypothetical protein
MNGLQDVLVTLVALAAVVLGILVRILFEQNTQIRSELDSRLKAIEGLEEPFARKLADAGPAPLKRALNLAIHLDTRFWAETLQLTSAELDEIKASIRLHDVLSKEAGAEDFDKWFYGDIRVHIQEWRGGHTHIEVEYPFCPLAKPKTIDLYIGSRRDRLWQFDLPDRVGEFHSGTLWLEWNGLCVTLYATSGRFGWRSLTETEPATHNIFLTAPLQEGPRAESYFKPDRRVEFYPDVYRFLPPWERCYEHLDLQKGLAWSLWVEDCDLFTSSQGNGSNARPRLLADWRERFAWDDAGKEWFKRVAKAVEAAQEKEMAELNKGRVSQHSEDDQPPAP